jgi:hypothetical protein
MQMGAYVPPLWAYLMHFIKTKLRKRNWIAKQPVESRVLYLKLIDVERPLRQIGLYASGQTRFSKY